MAAITAVLSLLNQGDEVIIPTNVYGGTYRVLDKVFNHFGITYRIVDTTQPYEFEHAIGPRTRAVLVESPANPLMSVTDLAAIADVAREHNVLSIVDNTFMTPWLQRPLELGADIVLHSATKYLGGHSDVVAGLVVVSTSELAERLAFIQNSTGGVLGPQDSFLLVRGIKTLGVRMDRHVENAQYIAEALARNPEVSAVHYPGLPDDPGYEVQRRQASGAGAMISFELAPGHDYRAFFRSTRLVALAESLGGVESLVCHPATMTHAAIPAEVREKVGITDGLIRLSVGRGARWKHAVAQAQQRGRVRGRGHLCQAGAVEPRGFREGPHRPLHGACGGGEGPAQARLYHRRGYGGQHGTGHCLCGYRPWL